MMMQQFIAFLYINSLVCLWRGFWRVLDFDPWLTEMRSWNEPHLAWNVSAPAAGPFVCDGGPGEVPRPVWPVHRALCTSIWPAERTYKAKRVGRVRALLKLQNSIVSGNCPLCPIYSTIGIHPVMKGYWPIIKISSKHWGRLGMQLVQLIFSFFGFWGEGEREKFFLFSIRGGGLVIHPWNGGIIMWQFIS